MLILSSAAAVALDPATTAWVSAVVTAGGTVSSPRQTLVNDLIVGLKADGVWAKLDRLWIFAAENTQSALIDLFALAEAIPGGGTAFTANRGYAGNGASNIRTLFNAATMGVKWTTAAAHMAAWDNTNRAAAATAITGAGNDIDSVTDLMPFHTSGVVTRINSAPSGFPSASNSTSQGFFIGQRNDATQIENFYNGVSLGTAANGGTTVVSVPFYICARNDNSGDGSGFMTDQVSMVSYGGKFSSTETLAYYNRLRTYMTAVGVP
jgi:hypothetical protein